MPSSSSSTSKTRWLVDGANLMGSRPDGWWNNPDKATRRWIEELDAYARATLAQSEAHLKNGQRRRPDRGARLPVEPLDDVLIRRRLH